MLRRLLLRALPFLATAALVVACDPAAPMVERPPFDTRAHLEEMIGHMERDALHRYAIDWPSLRSQVLAAGAGAKTVPQTFDAIRVALGLLGDNAHSYYIAPSGQWVRAPGHPCAAPASPRPVLPEDVGYVRVGPFSGGGSESVAFARSVQDSIRAMDRDGLVGWVVDLRGNMGGNMWPMIAGLGPILGDGVLGYFVFPTGYRGPWEYRDGASTYEGSVATRVEEPYELRSPGPRVAVLMDGRIGSSGEATLLAFRNRPGARLFGTPSCGYATAVRGFALSGGATLGLTTSWLGDRTGATFDREVPPDEVIPDPAGLVERALEWLRGELTPGA